MTKAFSLGGLKIFVAVGSLLGWGGLTACEYHPERLESKEAAPAARPEAAPVEEFPRFHGLLTAYVTNVQASTVSGPEHPAEYAFDGSATTRWSSAFLDGQWIAAYFDRTVSVDRVEVYWELARASDFSVQMLRRDGEWVELSRCTGEENLVDTVQYSAGLRTTGLRIVCHRRVHPEWGNSIFEIKVNGYAEGAMPQQKLEMPKAQAPAWVERERETAARLMKAAGEDPVLSTGLSEDALLELVSRRAFDYFWWETNPTNGLTRDRGRNFRSSEDAMVCSVAAVGFALSAYVIGAERGWATREELLERVRITLRTFDRGPIRNDHGFFPHFVHYQSAADMMDTEISTIDTALFLAGLITVLEYFDDPEIRETGQRIMERVDWAWALNGHANFVSHGVGHNGHFLDARWGSFTEGILIYLIGIGSPTHPLPAESWQAIDRYRGQYEGYSYLCEHGFQSIFRYQYPALWFDFREKTDPKNIDYFETVAVATLAMRQYCLRKASSFPYSYGPALWGQGAADGPGDRYMIYGFPPGEPYSPVDGTVIPYASLGSMPFVPRQALRALRALYDEHHEIWGKYGFTDSFNPTMSFVARDVIGLDQGTILLGIENYRSGLIWKLFMKNAWIKAMMKQTKWKFGLPPDHPAGAVDLIRSGEWRGRPGDGAFALMSLNDSDWLPMCMPDHWENEGQQWADYDGVGWYRARFLLSEERLRAWLTSGRPVTLTIGAVDDADATYLNGSLVGQTPAGQDTFKQRRRYRVPPGVLKAGMNVLAVRVTDVKGEGGLWLPPVELGLEK